MKKQLIVGVCLLIALTINPSKTFAFDADRKPPRPERVDEEIPERPSEYHVWREGRWKWKKKDQAWTWKSGSWSFDHDYYRWKRANRFGRNAYFNSAFRSRLIAVPIGRGYYRLVRIRY